MRAGPSVFLVGFMGSGKSAVARALAARIRWTCADSDERIESREGRCIAEIFADSGEAYFRTIERAVLAELAETDGHVVATGGGAFLDPAIRRRLNGLGTTVWLDVPLDVLRTRVGEGRGRPLWIGNDAIGLRAVYERRRAAYALACHKIDAIRSVGAVVDAILSDCSGIWR